MLPDLPTNFPAYSGRIPRSAGTLAQILRADGYATFCVGKWHLVPRDQRVTGPYDMWPTGLGFDRYYGFLNGETNQWTPNLVRDTNHVEPPREPADGYHLDADLADNAIAYLRELRISHPQRPFLLWYASAAPHAPHQAPPEWIDRFRGHFDDGWDAWRDATLARQIALGIVPEGTRLSSRPPWIEEWSDDRRAAPSALRPDDGSVRGVHRARRPSHRPGPRPSRRDRRPRQHGRRVRVRQRRVGRRRSERHLQPTRALHLRRTRRHRRRARAHRRPRRLPLERPLPVGVGARREHAVPALEAVHVRRRRARPVHPRRPGHRRRRRRPRSVLPRDRHPADRARALRHPPARRARRCRADELRRHEPRPGHRERDRARGAHQPVLRVLGQPRDVPRRLEGRHRSRQPTHRRRTRPDRRQPRLRDRHLGALRHPQRSDRIARPRGRRTGTARRPRRPLVRRRGTESGVPARRRRREPHHAHARPVDRVPDQLQLSSPATRSTRSPGRTSPAASAWSPPSTDRSSTTAPAVLCEQGDWISGWAWYLTDGEVRWCIAGKGGTHTVCGPAARDGTSPGRARRARRRATRGRARRRRQRDRAPEPRRASTARLGARRRVPHRRLRAPVPGQRRVHATRTGTGVTRSTSRSRSDHSRRSTSTPSSRESCATSDGSRRR